VSPVYYSLLGELSWRPRAFCWCCVELQEVIIVGRPFHVDWTLRAQKEHHALEQPNRIHKEQQNVL